MTNTPENPDRSPAHDPVITEAAIAILDKHYVEHSAVSGERQVQTVYAHAETVPDDAHPAVKITEDAFKKHLIAAALFHEAEARRFKTAIDAATALK